MRLLKRKISLVIALTIIASSCVHNAPSGLSSVGLEAFNKTRIIKELDVVRDLAIDANATTPPLVATDTTRKIVQYHRATLLTINQSGVKAMSVTALDEIVKTLPDKEKNLFTPYVALLKTILEGIQ